MVQKPMPIGLNKRQQAALAPSKQRILVDWNPA
jgi:hypothetical protein